MGLIKAFSERENISGVEFDDFLAQLKKIDSVLATSLKISFDEHNNVSIGDIKTFIAFMHLQQGDDNKIAILAQKIVEELQEIEVD